MQVCHRFLAGPALVLLVACSGEEAAVDPGTGGGVNTGGTGNAATSAGGSGGSGASSAAGGAATGGSSGSTATGGGPGAGGAITGGSGGTPSTGGGGASGGDGNQAGAAGSAGGGSGGFPPNDRSAAAVCARWNADRADLSEGTWSGSVAACDPGDISAEGRANALKLYNLYRWLADLPPVTTDPERDRLAQACALLMEANDALSHDPPMSWACWTEDGDEGASSSNISSGPGVRSADAYMIDNGNPTTIGHRRWILSNSLGPIGLGSTATGASCMQNLGGQGDAGKPWMAWPPPGNVPLQAFAPSGRSSLDDTGWTVQSDGINLQGASVTVTSDGENLPVTVTQLLDRYGARYALRFNPDGWETEAGRTYSVSVTGIQTEISYDVSVVDCAP